jgi:N-acetyl sugar amidotransferase
LQNGKSILLKFRSDIDISPHSGFGLRRDFAAGVTENPFMARNYQICNRCVMDTSDREIIYDGKGFCNHCTNFFEHKAKYQSQDGEYDSVLEHTIKEIKSAGKGKDYDCISGISGGIDSCYLAYLAKQQGLRVLAVHMDNGWNSEEAVQNIKNVTRKLGIDYASYVLDWEEFRDLQVAFLKASIPEADTPADIAIPAALHYFAAKHGVKHILLGGNFSTEGILPASWHYNAKDMKYFGHIQRTFGQKKIRKFPTFDFKKEMYYKLVKGIKMVYPLNYVRYLKEDVHALAKEKLDWKSTNGKHHESVYTGFIQSYYLYEKFGIDYRRATFSSQICLGDVDRGEALEQLETKPYEASKVAAQKHYISKKLQITEDEFERILNSPPKWYWDYPNDIKKLGFIYDTYRKLFKKDKLASF